MSYFHVDFPCAENFVARVTQSWNDETVLRDAHDVQEQIFDTRDTDSAQCGCSTTLSKSCKKIKPTAFTVGFVRLAETERFELSSLVKG